MARPQKPYRTSWGDTVYGLCHDKDGRWRNVATGERFSESDERLAVQRFRNWEAKHRKSESIFLPVEVKSHPVPLEAVGRINGHSVPVASAALVAGVRKWALAENQRFDLEDVPSDRCEDAKPFRPTVKVQAGYDIPEAALWAFVREQLVLRPEVVARKVGIPELANLAYMDLPQAPIPLEALIENYRVHNPSQQQSKNACIAAFRSMMKATGAKMLGDLTAEVLLNHKIKIEANPKWKSPATKRAYYGRIRFLIAFGLKTGFDAKQIRSALDRCRCLWTPEPNPVVNPRPINRDDFHKLLDTAGNGSWRVWLLLGLNLCMTLGELVLLEWNDFDIEAGTFRAIRHKTRRKRIPRAAVLWQETVAALKTVKRTQSKWVFISSHGKHYNKATRHNDFADLARKADCPNVRASHIRDGAYTVSAQAATDVRFARVLAGHHADGYADNYVLRNPAITAPACEAVYKAYGPFPTPQNARQSH